MNFKKGKNHDSLILLILLTVTSTESLILHSFCRKNEIAKRKT